MRAGIAALCLLATASAASGDETAEAKKADPRAWIVSLARNAAGEAGPAAAAGEIAARGEEGRAALSGLLDDVRKQPRAVREGSVRLAGALALREAEPRITALALRDPDREVRSAAADWVAGVVGETPPAALKALCAGDESDARHAAELVAVVGDRQGVETMVKVVRMVIEARLDQTVVSGFREIDVSGGLQDDPGNPRPPDARPLNIELPEVEHVSVRTTVSSSAAKSVRKVFQERVARRSFETPAELDRWWDGSKDSFR